MAGHEDIDKYGAYSQIDVLTPAQWNERIDEIWENLPSGEDGLLPIHFLRSTYPKIGGQLVQHADGSNRFWGLLLPGRDHDWTLRAHWLHADAEFKTRTQAKIITLLDSLSTGSTHWYETSQRRQEKFFGEVLENQDSYTVASPDSNQARLAIDLQRRIWNVSNPPFVYPFDLYHPKSGFATRLVALRDSKVYGFLFGFYARGKQWFGNNEKNDKWLESQLLGIDPAARRMGIARQLKLSQRQQALEDGIALIHWTVDPLQAGNAFLNLNGLGGVAVYFYPNYYPFQNDLNRVRASRVGISWLLNSDRVRTRVDGDKPDLSFGNLAADSSTEIVAPISFVDGKMLDVPNWKPDGEILLIQIPRDWNTIQRDDLKLAQIWREVTDAIFSKIIGTGGDDYALTAVVKDPENAFVYLVAERSPGRFS